MCWMGDGVDDGGADQSNREKQKKTPSLRIQLCLSCAFAPICPSPVDGMECEARFIMSK